LIGRPTAFYQFVYLRQHSAKHVLFIIVEGSVCLCFVHHIVRFYQNDASQDHKIFTEKCHKTLVFVTTFLVAKWGDFS